MPGWSRTWNRMGTSKGPVTQLKKLFTFSNTQTVFQIVLLFTACSVLHCGAMHLTKIQDGSGIISEKRVIERGLWHVTWVGRQISFMKEYLWKLNVWSGWFSTAFYSFPPFGKAWSHQGHLYPSLKLSIWFICRNNSVVSRVRLLHLQAVGPWTGALSFQCLNFLYCKMRIVMEFILQGWCEDAKRWPM